MIAGAGEEGHRPAASAPALRELRGQGIVVVVEEGLEEVIQSLGLTEPGRLETLLERRPGSDQGRARTAIVPLPGDGRRLHLRPVVRGGLLGPWLGARLTSLAGPLRELETTALLYAAGAPVPAPGLVAGQRVGLHWEATVATIHEEGALDGASFLAGDPSGERLVTAARAAGRSVRRLHDLGVVHGDLHVANLLLRELGDDAEVIAIDFAGACVQPPLTTATRMRELMRLQRSLCKRGLEARVGARGEAAFFGAYVGRDRALRRALLSHRAWEALRTRVHRLSWRSR